MKKITFTLLILACVLALNSCKKKVPGCTNSTATNYNSDANDDDGSCTYALAIGQSYQGGKIAYIIQQGDLGYDANVKHGIIAAPTDQGTGAVWGCFQTPIGGTSTAYGTGQANTTAIVNACSEAGIAARLCNDLIVGSYSDWYLPSKDELDKLLINQIAIGGFGSDFYWSSSEYAGYEANGAWYQSFNSGANYEDKYRTHSVRAIRAF